MVPPPQKDGYAMVWWDDFQGPAGSSPNTDLWNIITGNGPANNNEIETYTTLATNVSLSGDGRLILVPTQVAPNGQWTSGRVEGTGPQSCDPNHKMIFEAAINIGNSGSHGIWPAFWALGESIQQVGWPKCGEWDIMETRLDQPWSQATIHWQDDNGNNQDFVNAQTDYPQGNTNTWTMIMDLTSSDYTQQSLTFQLNGNTYLTATPAAMNNASQDQWSQITQGGFYPILNIAVGGENSFPGPTDGNTQGGFASDLAVDYVAIYKSDT